MPGRFMVVDIAGGSAGIAQRLQHYRQETGNYHPLAYQVVTHHHNDHPAGIQDAVAAGATLITVAANVDAVKSDGASPDAHVLVASGRMTIGQGDRRVELYEVSTIHAARIFSKPDMQDSVATFEDNACVADRPV